MFPWDFGAPVAGPLSAIGNVPDALKPEQLWVNCEDQLMTSGSKTSVGLMV